MVLSGKNNVLFTWRAGTTLDLSLSSGDQIPIENATVAKLPHIAIIQLGPEGVVVHNRHLTSHPINSFRQSLLTGVARAPYVGAASVAAAKSVASNV